MADPKRWLSEGDAPDHVRQLLRAIEIPEPPSAAKQGELVKKLATLAAGASVAPVAALNASWVKLAFAWGGAAGTAALLLAAFQIFSGTRGTPAAQPLELAVESTPSLVAAPLAPAPEAAARSLSPPDSPSVAATPRLASNEGVESRAAADLPARSLRPSNGDALAAEEALLERARGAASSAPARAWELLERHRRRFPAGQLVAERLSLSVDVLQRLGQTQAAQAQAEALMRRFPRSVYAVQLRQRLRAPR